MGFSSVFQVLFVYLLLLIRQLSVLAVINLVISHLLCIIVYRQDLYRYVRLVSEKSAEMKDWSLACTWNGQKLKKLNFFRFSTLQLKKIHYDTHHFTESWQSSV